MQLSYSMEVVMTLALYASLKHTSPAANLAIAYHLISNMLPNELSNCVYVGNVVNTGQLRSR